MKEKVYAVMDAAVKAGEKVPSIRAVRAAIGSGSLTDITKYVQEWKKEHPAVAKVKAKVGFSEEEARQILVSAWDVLNPIIQAQTDDRLGEMSLHLKMARKEVEDFREELFIEARHLEQKMAQADEKAAEADRRVAEADRRGAEAEKRADEAEKAFEELSAEHQQKVADLQKNVEAKDKLLRDLNEKAKQEELEKKELLERLQEQKDLIAMLKAQLPKAEKPVSEKEAPAKPKKETTANRTGELF